MTKSTIVQLSDKVRTVTRGDGTMSDLLYDLLTTPTPHGHESKIHHLLPFMRDDWQGQKPVIDEVGNIILDVGTPKKDFRTVFSCHMDTVHTSHETRMGLMYTLQDGPPETEGMIYAFTKYTTAKGEEVVAPSILGADDKVGMFIMLNLIENNVPGRYIFHIGEERGGIGSKHIATKTPDVLKHMRRAIAFDRMHYSDTISFQAGGRCCSTEFSTALANEINECLSTRQISFKPDVRGVWTDTANYTSLVAECTNLSVGYFNQHTTQEHFDLIWLKDILLPALLKVNWETLPTVRDKTAKEPEYSYSYNYGKNHNTNYSYDYGKVANSNVQFKDVNKDTPLYRLPKWKPLDGIPEELPENMLTKLCEGYVFEYMYKSNDVASSISMLLAANKKLQETNREMRRHIAKTGDEVYRNTSLKMNAIKRLMRAYKELRNENKIVIEVSYVPSNKTSVQCLNDMEDMYLDFGMMETDVNENFIRAPELQANINKFLEDVAITFHSACRSSPTFTACFKNLVKVIKRFKDEPGITRLYRAKEDAQ